MAAIGIDLAQISHSLLDRLAVLSRALRVGLGLDHPVGEERQDQGKLLLALGLTA